MDVYCFPYIQMLICVVDRFDGFTSTFQDKLFKGYDMEIHNQIFYTTSCSCILSLIGKLLIVISILVLLNTLVTFWLWKDIYGVWGCMQKHYRWYIVRILLSLICLNAF